MSMCEYQCVCQGHPQSLFNVLLVFPTASPKFFISSKRYEDLAGKNAAIWSIGVDLNLGKNEIENLMKLADT